MASIGVSKPDLAHLMGMSPQNIFAYFQRDDMRLSFAHAVVNKLGYELIFSLDREDASSSLSVVEIELPQGTDTIGRLAFLRVAMSKYGIKRKELADRLGLNYAGVNRWFRVDDISISYLFKIAELYDLKVKTTIKPKQTGV